MISPVEVPAMPPVLADWFVLVGLAAIWHSLTQQFSILPLLRPTKILVPSAVLLLFDVIDTLLDSNMEIFNYAGDIDGSEYTCGAIAGIDRYIVKGVILSVKGLGKVIVCLGVSYLF